MPANLRANPHLKHQPHPTKTPRASISPLLKSFRSALAIIGLLSVVVGIAMLVWPTASAKVIVAIFAVWMAIQGIVYLGIAFSASDRGGWSRFGIGLLGLLFLAAAVICLLDLPATTLVFAVWVGVFIGFVWIWQGIMAFTGVIAGVRSGWGILFGILSIIAGGILVFSPYYVTIVCWVYGISLIVLGLVQFIQSFFIGKK